MEGMTRQGRQDCSDQCGPVYTSSPTGVRVLVLVYTHFLDGCIDFFVKSN